MNAHQAKEYVDLIVEQLAAWDIISQVAYGRITMNQLEELADKLVAKSEE